MARDDSKVEELLQDLLIVQLTVAGVPLQEIRKVVGVNMNRVTRISKALKKARD